MSTRAGISTTRLKPFAGVDGEGGNTPDGQHHYYLLRAGEYVLENNNGDPLEPKQILYFLSNLPKDKLYVSYYFDYDVTMILRGLPWNKVQRLLDMDCRRVEDNPCSRFPVDWNNFQIDYLPHKEFRVRRRTGSCLATTKNGSKYRRWLWTPWTIISDTGSFFQRKFCTNDPEKPGALDLWFKEPEFKPMLAMIAKGKAQREEFTFVTEEERTYNEAECIMLARLMEKFRTMCEKNGLRPRVYQGPGHLVSAAMRGKIPRNKDLVDFWETPAAHMANDGYYGGRFENGIFGKIEGPVYQYDINSAYANTYRQLPCLLHGTWRPIKRMPSSGIFVGEVSFKHHEGLSFCTLPVRMKNDGILAFPMQGRGVYWSPELLTAQRYASIQFHTGYAYEQHCDCDMFDFVYDIYNERKRLGKDTAGLVLKTLLASIYGKLAQSIGCAPYSNPVWASLIVSITRSTLIEGALNGGYGDDVIALATDGIFCREPRESLPIGSELGQWTLTEYDQMFSVQSGIYFLPKDMAEEKEASIKTRGTSGAVIARHLDDFKSTWDSYCKTGNIRPVEVPITQFIGLKLANARNKPELAGQWIKSTKQIAFDWISKRTALEQDLRGSALYTSPPTGSPDLYSTPYSRNIGGFVAGLRDEMSEQPEWGPQLW